MDTTILSFPNFIKFPRAENTRAAQPTGTGSLRTNKLLHSFFAQQVSEDFLLNFPITISIIQFRDPIWPW